MAAAKTTKPPQKPPPTFDELSGFIDTQARNFPRLLGIPIGNHAAARGRLPMRRTQQLIDLAELAMQQDIECLRIEGYQPGDTNPYTEHLIDENFRLLSGAITKAKERSRFK